MTLSEVDQPPIPAPVRRHGHLVDHRPGRTDRCCGVSVLVRVDADDNAELICKHGPAPLPKGVTVSVPVRATLGRTVMGHTLGVDELLIRPTHDDRAGAGSSSGQVPFKATEHGANQYSSHVATTGSPA